MSRLLTRSLDLSIPRLQQTLARILHSCSGPGEIMENEELAALRATLLAAQRQPLALKVRQARLSALLSAGDDLLPYVLSASCSDPRDRVCGRDQLFQLRLLEGGSDLPHLTRRRRP